MPRSEPTKEEKEEALRVATRLELQLMDSEMNGGGGVLEVSDTAWNGYYARRGGSMLQE